MVVKKVYCDICKEHIFGGNEEHIHKIYIENKNVGHYDNAGCVTPFDICDKCLLELLNNVTEFDKRNIEIVALKEMEK